MKKQSLREALPGSPTEEVKEASNRLRSDKTIRTEDIITVVEAVSGSLWNHIYATEAIKYVADISPGVLEDRYPDIVESILVSRDTQAVAAGMLSGCASLRTDGVSVATIRTGIEMMCTWLAEMADDLDTKTETTLALQARDHADSVEGREQLVVESVGDAFEEIPRRRAVAAGLDPIDAMVDLRVHADKGTVAGINENGEVGALSEDDIADAQTSFRRLYDGLAGAELILLFERDPAQLLRSEAVLLERI